MPKQKIKKRQAKKRQAKPATKKGNDKRRMQSKQEEEGDTRRQQSEQEEEDDMRSVSSKQEEEDMRRKQAEKEKKDDKTICKVVKVSANDIIQKSTMSKTANNDKALVVEQRLDVPGGSSRMSAKAQGKQPLFMKTNKKGLSEKARGKQRIVEPTSKDRTSTPTDKKISPYNKFMKNEYERIKAEIPGISHKEAFNLATMSWGVSQSNPKNQAKKDTSSKLTLG